MDQLSRISLGPPRYPEDLAGNLRLVEHLAPLHCTACHGYHLSRAKRRLQPEYADALDRPEIMDLVRGFVAQLRPASGIVDILIAGSGDTNLLATCANAASTLGPGIPPIRYAVIDRCQTPLELCQVFGHRYGLTVRTQRVEMSAPASDFSADLILVHSLLRFVPQEEHRRTMSVLRGWLKPGGAIIFSHRLMEIGADVSETRHLAEYQTARQLMELFEAVGLRVGSMQEPREDKPPPGRGRGRYRILALLQSVD